ncbi:hypothetical protein COCON_G00025260 [Conger conger]|uniref:Reverse transcriptase domain-containing protein n=1 Tax=Conger conger TaxID=82655 RepID=A0A9Q1DXK9_CONCO|nr:hypothetical protein COCON_G00025260 [Conger conger]
MTHGLTVSRRRGEVLRRMMDTRPAWLSRRRCQAQAVIAAAIVAGITASFDQLFGFDEAPSPLPGSVTGAQLRAGCVFIQPDDTSLRTQGAERGLPGGSLCLPVWLRSQTESLCSCAQRVIPCSAARGERGLRGRAVSAVWPSGPSRRVFADVRWRGGGRGKAGRRALFAAGSGVSDLPGDAAQTSCWGGQIFKLNSRCSSGRRMMKEAALAGRLGVWCFHWDAAPDQLVCCSVIARRSTGSAHVQQKRNVKSVSGWPVDIPVEHIHRRRHNIAGSSPGATPQGCCLSPKLFSLYTYDCASNRDNNTVIKYADDTTILGLIKREDESSYRDLVHRIIAYGEDNDLVLNLDKTKELILDFRKKSPSLQPLVVKGTVVERTESYRFLGLQISESLSWAKHTAATVQKAQQRLYFIRLLKKARLGLQPLTQVYRGLVESILTSGITVWYGNTTMAERKKLQRVIKTAERIIGSDLPSMDTIYTQRCRRRAQCILKDKHPAHTLFKWVDLRHRRPVSIKTHRARFHNSFFPATVRLVAQDIKEGRKHLTPH